MGVVMKLLLNFVFCSLCCGVIKGQSQFCLNPPDFAMISDNFAVAVGSSDQAGSIFNLTEIFYNCIAYGGSGGNEFRQMTITGRYEVDSGTYLGQAEYQCTNPGAPQWNSLRVILRNGSATNAGTTRACADCQGTTNGTCTPCHSSCTGLNRCTGPLQSDCCNYLDKNRCTTQCSTNMVATSNTNYSCVCSGLYTGADCMVCNRSLCQHGMASADCTGCVCDSGYTGVHCDSDIDECDTPGGLCQNGGSCTNTDGNFTCDCPVTYGGSICADQCYACCDSPCTRGGTCISNNVNNYTCMCVPEWEGPRCQDFVGGCYSDPCMNGGQCISDISIGTTAYQCRCPVGFTGMNCEMPIDYCASTPCQNGGWCTNNQTGPVCECLQGFIGSDCGQPVLTCNIEIGVCGEHGSCVNRTTENRIAIFCSCDFGYMGDFCDTPVSDCSMDPCYHRGTCNPSTRANAPFACTCEGEWKGHYCTECSLRCGIGRSDVQCTRCICDNDMCNPSSPDDGGGSDIGLIVGIVLVAVVVLIIAVILALIAVYYIRKSGQHDTQRPKPQQTFDQFETKLVTMPKFTGSLLRTSSTFGSRIHRNIPSTHEDDHHEETDDDDKKLLTFQT